jgi:hypothetical protein
MDWMKLAQDRDRWRALVNAKWTSGFHKMRGIPWLAEKLLPCQEGLCSLELLQSYSILRHISVVTTTVIGETSQTVRSWSNAVIKHSLSFVSVV